MTSIMFWLQLTTQQRTVPKKTATVNIYSYTAITPRPFPALAYRTSTFIAPFHKSRKRVTPQPNPSSQRVVTRFICHSDGLAEKRRTVHTHTEDSSVRASHRAVKTGKQCPLPCPACLGRGNRHVRRNLRPFGFGTHIALSRFAPCNCNCSLPGLTCARTSPARPASRGAIIVKSWNNKINPAKYASQGGTVHYPPLPQARHVCRKPTFQQNPPDRTTKNPL